MLGSNILEKIGGGFMDVGRGAVGLFKAARGDTADTVVAGSAPVNYANLTVYGTLAALAILLVVKSPKRGR
jgi:hypothetical protein